MSIFNVAKQIGQTKCSMLFYCFSFCFFIFLFFIIESNGAAAGQRGAGFPMWSMQGRVCPCLGSCCPRVRRKIPSSPPAAITPRGCKLGLRLSATGAEWSWRGTAASSRARRAGQLLQHKAPTSPAASPVNDREENKSSSRFLLYWYRFSCSMGRA